MSLKDLDLQLEIWRRDLIDFSRRNGLLNLSGRTTRVPVSDPSPETILAMLISGRSLRIHPENDDRSEESADEDEGDKNYEVPVVLAENEVRATFEARPKLARSLRTLLRRSEQEFMDKGIRTLYIVFGQLRWRDNDEEWVSPILLAPIELTKIKEGVYDFNLSAEEDLAFNPALVEKLREDMGLEISIDVDEDDPGMVQQQLARAIRGRKGWSVESCAIIGTFSFAKDVMFRDLKNNAETIKENELVSALAFGADSGVDLSFSEIDEDKLDVLAPPSRLASILDADSTQRQAIVAAKAGRSFVIDGPPGTGKSQTIANIIAELIADGRSVLFVSEKAAALEVVQDRLEGAGLGSFLLPLHSQKVTRKEFANLLMGAVNERVKAGLPLSPLQVKRLESRQKSLSAYAAALNEIRMPLRMSLYEVLGQHARLNQFADAPVPVDSIDLTLTPEDLISIEDAAGRLSRAWSEIDNPDDFVWRGLEDAQLTRDHQTVVNAQIVEASLKLTAALEVSAKNCEDSGVPTLETVAQVEALATLSSMMVDRPKIPTDWLVTDTFGALVQKAEETLDRLNSLQNERENRSHKFARWIDIDPAIGERLIRLQPELKKSRFSALLESDFWTSLKALIEEMSALADGLNQTLEDQQFLEGRFGDSAHPTTLGRSRILASAAQLAGRSHRPDALWFTAVGINAAQEAIDAVQPLVTDYWTRAKELEQYFQPAIREFPIEDLFPDGKTAPALSVFSGVGRSNRRALAGLSKSGKLTKDERDRLAAIRELQVKGRSLQPEYWQHEALGDFYYQGVATDFEALRSALDIAKTTVEQLATAEPEKLATALGRAALDVAETERRGSRMARVLDSFDDLMVRLGVANSGPGESLDDILFHLRDGITLWTNVCEALESTFSSTKLSAAEMVSLVIARADYSVATKKCEALAAEDGALLGQLFGGLDTNVDEARAAVKWASAVREALPSISSPRLASRIIDEGIDIDTELVGLLHDFHELVAKIGSHFSQERRTQFKVDLAGDISIAIQVLEILGTEMEQIDEAVAFQEASDELASLGLKEVTQHLKNSRVSASAVEGSIKKSVLAAWIESILATEKTKLSPLDKANRDKQVYEFSEIDRTLRHDAASRVAEIANGRRPRTAIGVVGIIKRESERKNRHMRISELLNRTKEVSQSIKPCFMMSPLTVSSFLPPDLVFDTVIFDEASQLTTANAINAVYRGRQLIVAGDEKQLPPTSFFDRGLDEDEGDDYIEDAPVKYESVLHQAQSGAFKVVGLRWHYRSRHESLITYSNYSFYKGQLVTYPSALQESEDLGVDFIHVPNGVYKRSGSRTNTVEAQKVVERVFFFADHRPKLSVGVVAFSNAQADEIRNQLEAARRTRPDLDDYFTQDRLKGFFVKNLEAVQGDERDVIIFSVGYGKDEHGKLTMSFGPVNVEGGWRRLNVAFTRARNRVELISSITAGDFTSETNTNVMHLKRYFDYASRGPAALAFEVSPHGEGPDSPFEEEVIQTIQSWGYEVDPQVGQAGYRIDMAVRDPEHPGSYVLGIECDGAAYHSSLVARDRDRLRQEVLEGLGWRLYRIWGPTWYRGRAAAERSLRAAIESAMNRDPVIESRSPAVPVVAPVHEIFEVKFEEASKFVQPYFGRDKRKVPVLKLDERGLSTGTDIDNFILDTVKREGPVSVNILFRRYALAAGRKLTGDRQEMLHKRVEVLVKNNSLRSLRNDFLAIPGQNLLVARRPDPDDELTKREAKNIAVTEIAYAIAHYVFQASAIEISEVETLVVRDVFGWERVTAQWKDAIDEAIQSAAVDGWWVTEDSILKRGPNFPLT